MRELADHGLIVDGHDLSRAGVLAQARDYLVAKGTDPFDAENKLVDRPGLVVRAWWGDDEFGFVQEHHKGAKPVTVVNV
jgi:hypothetical protein